VLLHERSPIRGRAARRVLTGSSRGVRGMTGDHGRNDE
jgi:hypothetical protein